ncbi:hypothetical protein CCP4SC76_600012 [Gammaproteobacteria bacterium]
MKTLGTHLKRWIFHIKQDLSRNKTIFFRYWYWAIALTRYRIFQRRYIGTMAYGSSLDKRCIIVNSIRQPAKAIIVYLHGMGDTVWDAMKDGIDVLPQKYRTMLLLPEIGIAPWCSVHTISDLNALLENLRDSHPPHMPIILSGTSMGGTIALSLLSTELTQRYISGIMVFSASSRLDHLSRHSTSIEVGLALRKNVGEDQSALKKHSPDYATIGRSIPVSMAYSPQDRVIPPSPLEQTAAILRQKKLPVRVVAMQRPPGHYRPQKKDIIQAFLWIHEVLEESRAQTGL